MRSPATLDEALAVFDAVIGLEVHAQLLTATKIFSAAPAKSGLAPNQSIAFYDLGLPGQLPRLNRSVVELGIRAGLALECQIRRESVFARKHYFYPDLPKGYQISQFDRPLAEQGRIVVAADDGTERVVRIHRIHLEEDAGKNVHDEAGAYTRLDYNRAGVPLAEIVTDPDIKSAGEAARVFRALHSVLVAIGACEGNMEAGHLRADANVSIRPRDAQELGTRTEIKNLNSFRFLEQAIESEILRQARILAEGGSVTQETRLYDSARRVTRSMRSKEESHDYRYFPDPDLPKLVIPESWIEAAKRSLPELPAARARRYEGLGAPAEAARVVSLDVRLAALFDHAIRSWPAGVAPIANLIRQDVMRELRNAPDDAPVRISGAELAALAKEREEGRISSTQGKKIFSLVWSGACSFDEALRQLGGQVEDTLTLEPLVRALVEEFPKERADYQRGKTKLLSFFIGQAMKRTQGTANPELLRDLLTRHLGGTS
ncbi:MAG: Asp-tRNA(Asn)/Glu-tRNA(Gln) amidotransferase subunit GatB [Deltaproteobacteria bacterium]|nr:Asp-tRNA(Asn)/Glu-tRNA(Gln) amidotransferase subunit GatB [Deltaproteobacteria bacterium]